MRFSGLDPARAATLLGVAVLAAAALLALAAPPSRAAGVRPHLKWAHCRPVIRCTGAKTTLVRTWRVGVAARHITRRVRLIMHVRGGPTVTRRLRGRIVRPGRLLVRVPADAVSGRVRLVLPGRRYSNALRVRVRRRPARPVRSTDPEAATVFDGNGMWIWYLSQSAGGSPAAIAAQARAHDVSTVFVKSGDGTSSWSQFTPATVAALKAQGLQVCAWQFVYGDNPLGEARVGAASVADGADCLVIDAESAYEGKYAQARSYITALRARIGADYPLALASFPYVDYHPGLPYSVFLGPGGASFNLPQVYWKEIGDSVATALAHTYTGNRVYGGTIAPLGQVYGYPRAADVVAFRRLSAAYGATGVSWWSWQSASVSAFNAVGISIAPSGFRPATEWPELHVGSAGDLVVWAQEHLVAAGRSLRVDGDFGARTRRALRAFQAAAGLPVTGVTDPGTWAALLAYTPTTPAWGSAAFARASRAGGREVTGPSSARLPARRNEVPGGRRHQGAR